MTGTELGQTKLYEPVQQLSGFVLPNSPKHTIASVTKSLPLVLKLLCKLAEEVHSPFSHVVVFAHNYK